MATIIHLTILISVLITLPGSSLLTKFTRLPGGAASHPRLFFDASDIDSLKIKAEEVDNDIWKPIFAYATSQIESSPPSMPPTPGTVDEYRDFGNRLIPFAFSCVITKRSDLCDLARRYLLAYARWDQWGEDSLPGLGNAHMMAGSAIAYDWLYTILTPDERYQVRTSLGKWSEKLYEASVNQSAWWHSSYLQNFYWTTHSALGLASLALIEDDNRAQKWLSLVIDKLSRGQTFLDGIHDGSWHESIAYQQLMLSTTLPFLVSLRHTQGIDLFPHKYLRAYPYWMLYTYIPSTGQFALPYGDFEWNWFGVLSHLLRFSAAEYSDGHAEWLAQQYTAKYGRTPGIWSAPWYVFELLFHDPSISAIPPTNLPLHTVFDDLQGVVWRTGWGNDDLVFGLKAGAYGGRYAFDTFVNRSYPWNPPCPETGCQLNIGHDHDDMNGYYLNRGGYWLAPESHGVGKYDTSFHNTLLIDGQGQIRPPTNHYWTHEEDFVGADGFIEDVANTNHFDFVAADGARRYAQIDGIEDFTRHVLFVRPDYFLMLDTVSAATEHQYEWISHFGQAVSVENDWIRGTAGRGQILGVNIISPRSSTVRTGNDGYPFVAVRPSGPVQSQRFLNLLLPTDTVSWANKPLAQLIEDSGKAIETTITNAQKRQIDDIIINYVRESTEANTLAPGTTRIGDYHFDGRVAVVSKSLDGNLLRVFLHAGGFLTDESENRDLIIGLKGASTIEVEYFDTEVAVTAQEVESMTLWAPGQRILTINGVPYPYVRNGEYVTVRVVPFYIPLLAR